MFGVLSLALFLGDPKSRNNDFFVTKEILVVTNWKIETMSTNETPRQNQILYQDESDIALAQSPGDSESKPKNRGGKGRRKIDIKYIDDKTRRQITVSI